MRNSMKYFLIIYKTAIWNIYDQLSRQNALLKYIPDQETKKIYADDPALKIKYYGQHVFLAKTK